MVVSLESGVILKLQIVALPEIHNATDNRYVSKRECYIGNC